MLARQTARVVLLRPEDVDPIRRSDRFLFPLPFATAVPPTAVALVAPATALPLATAVLDDRVADAELLLGAARRIEPDGQSLAHDFPANSRVGGREAQIEEVAIVEQLH